MPSKNVIEKMSGDILSKAETGPCVAVAMGLCTVGLCVVALLAPGSVASVQGQSADLVLCDRIAADPTDPDRPPDVKGVAQIAPSDVATAIKFCKVAAPAVRRAAYQLGRAYAANRQMPEAMAAYRKAADKGSTAAMVELAASLASGAVGSKDEAEARNLLLRAAQGGNARAAAQLAALPGGSSVASDPAEARALLAKAAETNSAEAQFQLGLMMADGVGGSKDDVGARAMFEKAAAQGHAAAMDWMGNFAETGRGGPKDRDAAKSYYEKAAALGNEDAKAGLERLKCPLVLKTKSGEVWTHLCF
jgi:TPR repeat protein